jgi:cytochrome c'
LLWLLSLEITMAVRGHKLSKHIGAVFFVTAVSLIALTQVHAQAQKEEHKLTLRAIMQELGAEHLRLTNALLIDDLKSVEDSARAIQGHPLPAEIVAAIKSKLGRDFRAFERIDEQSHQAAASLAKRAAAKDLTGSAIAFGQLTQGCVSCHRQFRASLRALSD